MHHNANLIRVIQDRTSQQLGMCDMTSTIEEKKQQEMNEEQAMKDQLEESHGRGGGRPQHDAPDEMGSTTNGRGNASSVRKENGSHNSFHSPSQSVRLITTHPMTRTCIHPAPAALYSPTARNNSNKKRDKTGTSSISSTSPSQQQEHQQENQDDSSCTTSEHETSAIKCGSVFGSVSERSDPEERSLPGDRGKDERRERNRLLARKRRERKQKWNDNMRKKIDQVIDENEVLRNKNKFLMKELLSLGVDARTVMSRIAPPAAAPLPPSSASITSSTNPGTSIKFPNQSSSMSISAPLTQYQPHQLLSLLGTTNGHAFQHTTGPPPQLPSPFFPPPILSLHSQQMIHSMIHPHPPQQHPWRQQVIPLASTGHDEEQGTTTISTGATETNGTTCIASNGANHHPSHQYISASNASPSIVGTEDILLSYRQALMVSQEIMSSAALCERAVSTRK